ncbi:MAG: hypothetical protein JWM78_1329 [Verrucomicrobiaceae bacterium]|nr:hypothetical protein [Verrucomicrobiaceae bacterium]
MINNVVNTGFQQAVEVRSSASGAQASSAAASQPASTTTTQESNAADSAKLTAAVTKLNDYVQNVQRNLSFSVDKDSGQTVIKVLDVQTNEVIRQIPPAETLRLAASLEERMAQLFVTERA